MTEKDRIMEALAFLKKAFPDFHPEVLLVLGSGLGEMVRTFQPLSSTEYSQVPGFVRSTVEGHAGTLYLCRVKGLNLAVMSGRVHLYEGYSSGEVVRNLRVLGLWGARTAVLTNAAGALNPLFSTGNIMLITDHINFTGENPLTGRNLDDWGPRFPDMSSVYCPELAALAQKCALNMGVPLEKGVYLGIKGPSLETPAETRAFRRLGGDAIGMSTTLEAIACRHLGLRVLGYSCLTNKNLPDCMAETSHAEILRRAQSMNEVLIELLQKTLPLIPGVYQK